MLSLDGSSYDLQALLELRAEGGLAAYLQKASLDSQPAPASPLLLLHAFLPAPCVLHTQSDALSALGANARARKHVARCFGGRVALLPYRRPGLELAKSAVVAAGHAPPDGGILLDRLGLITWGETKAAAAKTAAAMVAQAQRYIGRSKPRRAAVAAGHAPPLHKLLPTLRGALSREGRRILCFDGSRDAAAFSLRKDASRICSGAAQPVALIKGAGVACAGEDPQAATAARDLFRSYVWVRQAAERLGGYKALRPGPHMPVAGPRGEFSGQIALVSGAARGIGRACAERLHLGGACVALLDLDLKAARAAAAPLGDRGLALRADISDESQVAAAFAAVVERWGGLDLLVSNAGLARCAPVMDMDVKDWDLSFSVNARGHFLCSREAARIFKAQGLGGNMVFISSKNVLAPGKDFAAYSASKAAQTQLAKVLALELAPINVRVNCVTPDGVFEDSRLWDAIRDERARAHGIPASKLKDFYVSRNLLKREVRPADVAEAVAFLASERSSKTTGSLLPVDGGVKEAFPR